MRRALAVAAFACVVLGVGAGVATAKDANTADGAQQAFRRYVQYLVDRKWEALYQRVHPAQQELVDQATFVACQERESPKGVGVEDLTFTRVGHKTVTIPGTDVKAKATVLTADYTVTQGSQRQHGGDTVYLFYKSGKWLYEINGDRLAACTGTTTT
jgi:hypothetical protein